MQYIVPTIYFLIVFFHALIDAYKIEKKGIYINHFVEGCFYVLICGAVSITIFMLTEVSWLPLILFPIITRTAFFDGLLNVFRGKRILYEGAASKTDSIEKWIGLPTVIYRIFYLLIYVGYLIIYLT